MKAMVMAITALVLAGAAVAGQRSDDEAIIASVCESGNAIVTATADGYCIDRRDGPTTRLTRIGSNWRIETDDGGRATYLYPTAYGYSLSVPGKSSGTMYRTPDGFSTHRNDNTTIRTTRTGDGWRVESDSNRRGATMRRAGFGYSVFGPSDDRHVTDSRK